MQNSGLLFIPDISGFTKFVNETDIEHSRYIIAELLENIINSNKMGLTISEIEGDAVLFYRFGKAPDSAEMFEQIKTMFCNFQKKIKTYEVRRACQCSACLAAVNLSLKIITHYGEFSTYSVSDYHNLFGKDVIVAHQLLKNDIELHEYWLATDNLLNTAPKEKIPEWMQWQQGSKLTEKGEVNFQYSMLTKLKDEVEPDDLPDLGLGENKIKVATESKVMNAMQINVLSIIGNLSVRSKWMNGVASVDMISHPINHVGVKYRSLFNGQQTNFYASAFGQNDDVFYYAETDDKKTISIEFSVKQLEESKTLVTVEYFLKKNLLNQINASFIKAKVSKQLINSLNKLAELAEQGTGYLSS